MFNLQPPRHISTLPKNSYIATLVERHTRYVILMKIAKAREEVFGSHELLRVVESYRNFLAEADYERVDFKRGIRNDRRQRVA